MVSPDLGAGLIREFTAENLHDEGELHVFLQGVIDIRSGIIAVQSREIHSGQRCREQGGDRVRDIREQVPPCEGKLADVQGSLVVKQEVIETEASREFRIQSFNL